MEKRQKEEKKLKIWKGLRKGINKERNDNKTDKLKEWEEICEKGEEIKDRWMAHENTKEIISR